MEGQWKIRVEVYSACGLESVYQRAVEIAQLKLVEFRGGIYGLFRGCFFLSQRKAPRGSTPYFGGRNVRPIVDP